MELTLFSIFIGNTIIHIEIYTHDIGKITFSQKKKVKKSKRNEKKVDLTQEIRKRKTYSDLSFSDSRLCITSRALRKQYKTLTTARQNRLIKI